MLVTFTLPYFQNHGILAPAYTVLGTHATPANVRLWGLQNGMDHSYVVRFLTYVKQVFFHFNLGHSYKQNIVGVAASFRSTCPAPSGSPRRRSCSRRSSPSRSASPRPQSATPSSTTPARASPSFSTAYRRSCSASWPWMLFSFHWPHLPSSPPSGVAPWAIFTDPIGFLLPVACLTLLSLAFLSRFMRGTVLEVLVQDYMRTAKAKGCSARRTLVRHAFRNALGPIVVILGLSIPGLLRRRAHHRRGLQLRRSRHPDRRRSDEPRHTRDSGHHAARSRSSRSPAT